MRSFSINLRGRIKNFNLPKNQHLIPLFEAIVNSIHAIEERRNATEGFRGNITIKIIRSDQLTLPGMSGLPPIESFEIVDNGVGFNEPNLESFLESDSTYKDDIGGKGVGRFSWLVAFEKANIESIYYDMDRYVKRCFEFSQNQTEINDSLETFGPQSDNRTTVRLLHCKKPYQDELPKQGNIVAMRIIHHCLVYFISANCPKIELIDENDWYNLNDMFKDKIKTEENCIQLNIGEEKFNLLHVKAEDNAINGHKLYLCAHNRLVETKELEKYITDLDREVNKEYGFWYVGVLWGKYLDDFVDMNRSSFNIPDEGENLINTISKRQIVESATIEIIQFLDEYLTPISKSKIQKIKDYVTNKAPQYRHLLKYMKDEILNIKPNLTDDKLDDELYKIKRQFDKKNNEKNKKLLEDLNNGFISVDEYKQRFFEQIELITSANSSVLAEYVAHRRVILDLMDFAIRKNDDGNFQKESYLHNLIYPMRTTSDEISYNNHNLWLIDEKLAYCTYISSDIPFDNDRNQKRTDVLILDCPVAVSDKDNDGTEYDTIILFELKRPMRNDYTDGDNPVKQLYDYISTLKSGNAKDRNGRIIRVGQNTKFYLYAICDVTPTLERFIEYHDFNQTPDKIGYYRYNDKFKAYIEILPYDKIINDAKRRNKILFEKLGI